MIRLEQTEVNGFKPAIRGMRNAMNSWDKSDSVYISWQYCDTCEEIALAEMCGGKAPVIGENDHDLMMRLSNAGTSDSKFKRMIVVYVDITAPLYWWKEFDTYKVGTVANSCSTMHKIHAKEFELDDFSHERLCDSSKEVLEDTIIKLNNFRAYFNEKLCVTYWDSKNDKLMGLDKKDMWWQMIQLLPSSYNQKRTVMLNYEVLTNIYNSRKNHKLNEWREFCEWIEELPYSEIITGVYQKSELDESMELFSEIACECEEEE